MREQMTWLKFKDRPANLPSEFRGCQWNDGWEFDAPAVLYYPPQFKRYGFGGNSSVIDSLVEDVCFALCQSKKPTDGGLAHECNWRGWGPRFDRRKNARHVIIQIEWIEDKDGSLAWIEKRRVERYGLDPFRTSRKWKSHVAALKSKLPPTGTPRT